MIVADLTGADPGVLCQAGVAHGLGRRPILVARHPATLPPSLWDLRPFVFDGDRAGLRYLRQRLAAEVRRLIVR